MAETDENANSTSQTPKPTDGEVVIEAGEGEELTLVDEAGKVVVRSNRETIDDSAIQTLTAEEIEELKKKGSGAGKDLIAKLLLSHTAIDQKTAYSLAKYKLLKTKKYIRRFTVFPLDVALLAQWLYDQKDVSKTLELRAESIGLVGCWADVHWADHVLQGDGAHGGKWMIVDDTGGLLVAAMAERMGILHDENAAEKSLRLVDDAAQELKDTNMGSVANGEQEQQTQDLKRRHRDDFEIPYSQSNTLTLIYGNSQPNLSSLRYFNYDASDPSPTYPYHPLFTNVLPISWLQLLAPEDDPVYSEAPPEVDAETLASYKTTRRGNYHRKRRRWARTDHVIRNTREGGFSGLAVASTMDPVSILRSTLPFLAGGAPVAIYSQFVEPLTALADCFSVQRRAAWVSSPPAEAEGKTAEELVSWEGTPEFPINPTLLLGASIQTSRARRWQVLPGRTHPFMTGKGGAEGYIFTGWKAVPVEGKITARGKFKKRKTETTEA